MTDSKQETSLSVWRKRAYFVWTLIGVCILIGVVGYVAGIFAVPIGILIWSLIFVFCLHPVVNFLDSKGVNRMLGTLASFLMLFAILIAVGFLMFSPMFGVSEQFADLGEDLPRYYDAASAWVMAMYDQYSDFLQNDTVRTWIDNAVAGMSTLMAEISSGTAAGIVGFGAAIANSVMVIGFAMVISFWLLMDLPNMGKEAYRLVPKRLHEDAKMIMLTLTSVIGGYIKGTLIQCFLIGAASGVAYAVVGLPSPIALAIITGLLNIIPVVGPWLGGVFAAVVGVMFDPFAALLALIAAIIIQQVVYTFISPKLMADSVDIHPALMILALMCGSAVGGVTGGIGGTIFGMLASIPLVAAAKALFVYYFEKNSGRRLVAVDGVFFKGDVDPDADHDPTRDAIAYKPQPAAFIDEEGARRFKAMTEKILPLDPLKGANKHDSDKQD